MLDPSKIRKDFSILSGSEGRLVYLDSASTTHKPNSVIAKTVDYYSSYNANVHRGIYSIAERATEQFELARDSIAQFFRAKSRESIVLTSGTTESVNLVAYSLCLHTLKEGDEILLSEMEHHSNIIPWQFVSKQTGFIIKYIPIKYMFINNIMDNTNYLFNLNFIKYRIISYNIKIILLHFLYHF